MNKIIIFLLLSLANFSHSQALRDCPSDPTVYWNNCIGTYTSNGDVFIGEFQNNMRNGTGTYTHADGSVYVGEYFNDLAHGNGTYTYSDGSVHIGKYTDGEQTGNGTYTFGEGNWKGDVYEGEFKDGDFHGLGSYTFSNGAIYEGFWYEGKYIPRICEDMGLREGSQEFGVCVNEIIRKL